MMAANLAIKAEGDVIKARQDLFSLEGEVTTTVSRVAGDRFP